MTALDNVANGMLYTGVPAARAATARRPPRSNGWGSVTG